MIPPSKATATEAAITAHQNWPGESTNKETH